jgi:Sap-like sulfolipid-1-addressing protein
VRSQVQIVEIFLLALASMVWPALLAVVVVALVSPRPVRLLSFFLAGALLTTVSIGAVIVFLLRDSSLVGGNRRTFGPVVDLVAGACALLLAFVLERHGHTTRKKRSVPDQPSWYERTIARGGALAFVVGVVLNIFPGVFPFVAMKDIAQLGYSVAATLALIVGFYLVMFLPAEVPLLLYLVVPAETTAAVEDLRDWLDRNGRRVAVIALAIAGTYLLVRGALKV